MRPLRGTCRNVFLRILSCALILMALGILVVGDAGPLHDSSFPQRLTIATALVTLAVGPIWALRSKKPDLATLVADLATEVNGYLHKKPQRYFSDPGFIPVEFEDAAAPNVKVNKTVAEHLDGRDWRRLVILGEAGSGKTVTAHQLMQDLLHGRKEGDPVPVRIPLSTWNTDRKLVDWLADHLTNSDLVRSRADARQLLEQGKVLPILDGLDEMDPPRVRARDTRALTALRKINEGYDAGVDKARLVVVCRRRRYRDLTKIEPLQQTTTLTLQNLTSEQQLAFLEKMSLCEAGRWRPEWRRIAKALTWSGNARGLARVLNTPWRMALLVTAYTKKDEDWRPLRSPDALLAMRPDQVPDHLLGLYTHAAATTYARSKRKWRRWGPGQVEHWLVLLARRLQDGSRVADPPEPGDEVVSETDLVLHRLWKFQTSPRMRVAELSILFLPFALSILLAERLGFSIPPTSFLAVAVFVVALYVVTPVMMSRSTRQPVPRRLRWERITNLPFFATMSLFVGGTVLILRDGLRETPVLHTAIIAGLLAPFVVTSAAWPIADHPQATLTGPRDPLRAELRYGLAIAFAASLLVGALFAQHLKSGWGFGYGFLFAALPALTASARAWRRHMALRWDMTGQLPLRLGAFLDECCEAGIMRVEGFAYQFRHQELQRWLARQEIPDPSKPS